MPILKGRQQMVEARMEAGGDEVIIPLPLARLRLEAEVESPLRLPDYAGSMLRGAFGRALRRLACMTRQPECGGCGLIRTCPYAIEPPPWRGATLDAGDRLAFGLTLFGRALAQQPLVLLAWQHALGRGVGAGEGRARLLRVVQEQAAGERVLLDAERGTAEPAEGEAPAPPARVPEAVTLRFVTPLRLQDNGRALGPDQVDARRLVVHLARRASLLAEFHGQGAPGFDFQALANHAATLAEARHLTWRDWTRYSSRQGQKMQLGGLVGEWTLSGDLAPLWPLLHLGQWLHVGKEAAFGLGRYELACPVKTSPAEPRKVVDPLGNSLIRKGELKGAIQTEP